MNERLISVVIGVSCALCPQMSAFGDDCTLRLEEEFSADPEWITDQPGNYFWDSGLGVFHATTDSAQPGSVPTRYAYTPIEYSGTSMRLEFDMYPNDLQWSAAVMFGLFDDSLSLWPVDPDAHQVSVWMGRVDQGRHLTLSVQGETGVERAENLWNVVSEGTWYHCLVEYSALEDVLELTVTERDSGQFVGTIGFLEVGGLSPNLDRIGFARDPSGWNCPGAPGYNCNASATVYVDDISFCAAIDCNSNGTHDSIDIVDGSSLDCNANGVPDECEMIASPILNVTSGDSYCTIQACINASTNGDECLVQPGTYNETIDLDGKAIVLRSAGGHSVTTIDGSGFTGSVVKCVNGEGFDTVIDGFTITGGSGVVRGGGMYLDGSSPTISDCVFRYNSAEGGAGLYCLNGSNAQVIRCVFTENNATFGGGGIRNRGSSPSLINCAVIANTALIGAGVFNLEDASPAITNCIIQGNVATGVSSSSGGGGAGIMNEVSSNPTITNCTVFENDATGTGHGGGMFSSDSSPVVVNSIFWGNTDESGAGESAQIEDEGSTSSDVSYTCVQGLSTISGIGNLASDPLLVNLHLSAGSPCIDAGNTPALPSGLYVDLDGNGRVLDDTNTVDTGIPAMLIPVTVDMGAYEFQQIGDLDGDGDVDLLDYAIFQSQFTGPNG